MEKVDLLDVALSSIGFLTVKEKFKIKENIDNLNELAVKSISELGLLAGRALKANWNGSEVKAHAEYAYSVLESKGIGCVIYGKEGYPELLKQIPDAPYALYFRGNIDALKKPCVSVVGTRNVCEQTARAAMEFSVDACKKDYCVVSGLAYGIDSFAHKGALKSGSLSSTCAVLPCGIETVVPYSNRGIARKILETGGVLVSEYMPGVPAENYRFVQRNRIIAALSEGTVVIQAPKGSGALLTADFALNYNRELVFHSQGFCEDAKKIARAAESDVKNEKKLSARDFIDSGSNIINDFDEYLEVLYGAPGMLLDKNKQLELF